VLLRVGEKYSFAAAAHGELIRYWNGGAAWSLNLGVREVGLIR
jgi:hypothetical protein